MGIFDAIQRGLGLAGDAPTTQGTAGLGMAAQAPPPAAANPYADALAPPPTNLGDMPGIAKMALLLGSGLTGNTQVTTQLLAQKRQQALDKRKNFEQDLGLLGELDKHRQSMPLSQWDGETQKMLSIWDKVRPGARDLAGAVLSDNPAHSAGMIKLAQRDPVVGQILDHGSAADLTAYMRSPQAHITAIDIEDQDNVKTAPAKMVAAMQSTDPKVMAVMKGMQDERGRITPDRYHAGQDQLPEQFRWNNSEASTMQRKQDVPAQIPGVEAGAEFLASRKAAEMQDYKLEQIREAARLRAQSAPSGARANQPLTDGMRQSYIDGAGGDPTLIGQLAKAQTNGDADAIMRNWNQKEQRGAVAGRFATPRGGTLKTVTDLGATMGQLDAIKLDMPGFKTGYLANKADLVKWYGSLNDPDRARTRTELGLLLAQYVKTMSGAQVSEDESKRLQALIPNENDGPVQLLSKFVEFRDWTARNLNTTIDISEGTGKYKFDQMRKTIHDKGWYEGGSAGAKPAAAGGASALKPKTVTQNGHTFTLNEQTGEYE